MCPNVHAEYTSSSNNPSASSTLATNAGIDEIERLDTVPQSFNTIFLSNLPIKFSFYSTNVMFDHGVFFTSTQRFCQILNHCTAHTADILTINKTSGTRMVYRDPMPHTGHVYTLWYITVVRYYKRYQPPA